MDVRKGTSSGSEMYQTIMKATSTKRGVKNIAKVLLSVLHKFCAADLWARHCKRRISVYTLVDLVSTTFTSIFLPCRLPRCRKRHESIYRRVKRKQCLIS